jgi:diguanylate cyclase (GGDEF)-like protein
MHHDRGGRKLAVRRGGAFFAALVIASLVVYFAGFDYAWPIFLFPLFLGAVFFFETGSLCAGVWLSAFVALCQVAGRPLGHAGLRPAIIGLTLFTAAGLLLGNLERRNHRLQRLLAASSLTDRLTSLYNYGTFVDYLHNEVRKVDRYGGSLALVMIDIDHFKRFNDRYGHEAGNELLRLLGETLGKAVRGADMAARYGGEEFAILIRGNEAEGLGLAERVRRTALTLSVPVRSGAATVTISAGVASYPAGARDETELVERADQALYFSKSSGRDRVNGATMGAPYAPAERRKALSA